MPAATADEVLVETTISSSSSAVVLPTTDPEQRSAVFLCSTSCSCMLPEATAAAEEVEEGEREWVLLGAGGQASGDNDEAASRYIGA